MRTKSAYLISPLLLLLASFWLSSAVLAAPAAPGDRLVVSGMVKNPQGRGVKDVEVEVLVNGQPIKASGTDEEIVTSKQGSFVEEFRLPEGTLPEARVEVKAFKPSWRPLEPTPVQLNEAGVDQEGRRLFQASHTFTLYRQVIPAFWIATLVLLLVYAIIALEWMHRTLAALLGAALILFISYTVGTFNKNFFVLSFEDSIRAIDMNVIFLLMGMMIIVGVLKKTGIFQWLAYKSYALARGNIFVLSFILQVVTAVTSAFLDNVTTMLLLIPVTIEIAVTLKINPMTLLIPEVFASNVGGTATLIGDPPNLLVQEGLSPGGRQGCEAHHFLFAGGVPHHRYEIDGDGLRGPDLHHLPLCRSRPPAHGAFHCGPDRGHGAPDHLPGGHCGDAGARGGMAHPDLLHRPVHGHRRSGGNGPHSNDRRMGERRVRRLPGGGHHHGALGVGYRVGLYR
jgi:hypothetical protein